MPLATVTGWNFAPDAPPRLVNLQGSYIPFPRTKIEREQRGDPRASIEERYPSRDRYLSSIKAAADALVADRLMLAEDVDAVVQRAAQHWDVVVGVSAASR